MRGSAGDLVHGRDHSRPEGAQGAVATFAPNIEEPVPQGERLEKPGKSVVKAGPVARSDG